MSRYDRRLKGADVEGDGARPGTAVCSLPSSSTQNTGMLGGSFLNRRSMSRQPISQNRITQRQINGLSVLQHHDQKINILEKRLIDIESAYAKNISLQDAKTEQVSKQFDLLNNAYHTEMKMLKDYIKDLEQKIKDLATVNTKLDNKDEVDITVNNIELIIKE